MLDAETVKEQARMLSPLLWGRAALVTHPNGDRAHGPPTTHSVSGEAPRAGRGPQAQGVAFHPLNRVSSPGAGPVQHLESGSICLTLLRAPGLGAPDHPVLCWEDPQGGTSL